MHTTYTQTHQHDICKSSVELVPLQEASDSGDPTEEQPDGEPMQQGQQGERPQDGKKQQGELQVGMM